MSRRLTRPYAADMVMVVGAGQRGGWQTPWQTVIAALARPSAYRGEPTGE